MRSLEDFLSIGCLHFGQGGFTFFNDVFGIHALQT